LEAYEISDTTLDLAPGYCSIPEPIISQTIKSDPGSIDVVLLPGSVYDIKGGRLGYGGGYYDRFLKDINATKIGLCFNSLIIDSISRNDWDVKMDKVISEI